MERCSLKPAFLIVLLLLTSSTSFAAEHYTEVWNPPEAQMQKSRPKARTPVSLQARKKHKGVTTVKKVADRGVSAQPAIVARGKTSQRQVSPATGLPRKIQPNGQVMRVAYPV
jgi:hypothetical protein